MKRALLIAFLLLCAPLAWSQSTTLSGQVTDAGSQPWNNGTFSLSFVPNPLYPAGPYTWTGGTLPTNITGTLSSGGAYTASVPSNPAISPNGTSWQLTVCPLATSPCFTTQNLIIQGATQTINVTPPAIAISLVNPPSVSMRAYTDSEIASAVVASFYYNLTSQIFHVCQVVVVQSCTSWTNLGSGGAAIYTNGVLNTSQLVLNFQNSTVNASGLQLSWSNPSGGSGGIEQGEISGSYTGPVADTQVTFTNNTSGNVTTSQHGFIPKADGNSADCFIGTAVWATCPGSGGFVNPMTVANQLISSTTGGAPIAFTFPSGHDGVPQVVTEVTASGATTPIAAALPGAATRLITGTTSTDTIASTDCNPKLVDYQTSVSVSVTLPTATTLAVANCAFRISNDTTGSFTNVTVTPTTWTINYASNYGASSFVIPKGTSCAFFVDAGGSAWDANCAGATVLSTGTIALPTSAITSLQCSAVTTVAVTNVTTSSRLFGTWVGDTTGVTGYAPAAGGGLEVRPYVTTGAVNVKVCNWTSLSVTPGAASINYEVH